MSSVVNTFQFGISKLPPNFPTLVRVPVVGSRRGCCLPDAGGCQEGYRPPCRTPSEGHSRCEQRQSLNLKKKIFGTTLNILLFGNLLFFNRIGIGRVC